MRSRPLMLLLLGAILTGCAIALPMNMRLASPYEDRARGLRSSNTTPIALRWMPQDFPSRIDIQGASGFVGSGSRTRVPIGEALTGRIRDVLNASIGTDPNSARVLTITVIDAKSKFKYGFSRNQLTYGETHLKARFEIENMNWEEDFSSQIDKSQVAATWAYLLEKSWDEVSLQVGQNVLSHLRGGQK